MKIIRCPLCSAPDYEGVCSKTRHGATYTVVRCSSCGFHYVNPEPDEAQLLALYDAAYSEAHVRTWHGLEDALNHQVIGELAGLGVGSLTDLGAGQGRLVRMALDAGIQAEGVEPSELNCRAARERYDLSLRQLTIQQYLEREARDLECVTMLNVLEHLPSPVSILRRAAAAMRPDAVLILVIPNVDFTLFLGGVRRAAGIADVYMLNSERFTQQGFDPPIHLSSFSARHLRHALVQAGFRIEKLSQAAVIGSANPVLHVAKHAVSTVGRGVELLTRGRHVWGYSLFCIARRR